MQFSFGKVHPNSDSRRFKGELNDNDYGFAEKWKMMAENLVLSTVSYFSGEKDSFLKYKEKKFKEILSDESTREHFSVSKLHYWAKVGDLDGLQKLLNRQMKEFNEGKRDTHPILALDIAGANVIHIAYLFEKYDIGHWLVERFPGLGLKPYARHMAHNVVESHEGLSECYRKEFMPYGGETILHMVIIRRDYEEVRWILDFYRDHKDSVPNGLAMLLNANATGRFFDARGAFYFGGYPLQFAVCSNHKQIFDIVLAFASSIDLQTAVDDVTGEDTILKDPRQSTYNNENLACLIENHAESRTKSDQTQVSPLGSNVIFLRDSIGNTVLHLCVRHCLEDMFEHVYNKARGIIQRELKVLFASETVKEGYVAGKICQLKPFDMFRSHGHVMRSDIVILPEIDQYESWLERETENIMNERLVFALNDDLHSPLTFAAAQIDKNTDKVEDPAKLEELLDKQVSMLHFVLDHLKKKSWTFGPMDRCMLNLNGIEMNHDLACYPTINTKKVDPSKIHCVIDWLCINDADKAIMIPEISKIIEAKWEMCGYPKFLIQFIMNILVTFLITFILIFANATPSLTPKYGTEWTVTFFYPAVMLIFIFSFIMEFRDFCKYHIHYFNLRGAARYDLICRSIKLFSFTCLCVLKWLKSNEFAESDDPNAEFRANDDASYYNKQDYVGMKVSLTVCVIFCWLHLYYFLMGFNKTGPFVLTIFRIVSKDVPYFLRFYMVVVIAFACALSILTTNGDYHAWYGIWHVLQGIWTLIQNTVNVTPSHDVTSVYLVPNDLQWLSDIITTIYYIVVVLIMLNLLIGMISNTYSLYSEYNKAILLMEKYNMMHAMERSLGDRELHHYRDQFCVVQQRKDRFSQHEARNPVGSPMDRRSSKLHIKPPRPANLLLAQEESKNFYKGKDFLFEVTEVSSEWFENKPLIDEKLDTSEIIMKLLAGVVVDQAALKNLLKGTAGCDKVDAFGKKIQIKNTLFIIDPQIDFHEEYGQPGDPLYHPQGTLAVKGANEDSERIAAMIRENKHNIREIFVSMDSHYPAHIAHGIFWKNAQGEHPEAFTLLTFKDIDEGVWSPVDDDEDLLKWVRYYVKALERKGRMRLVIWPEHCIVGSAGHAVVPIINKALQEWASVSRRPVTYIMKGQNCRTEMYSALEAEVEDPQDCLTSLNYDVLSMLKVSDRLLVCGEAMSHCVNYTLRDIMKHWHGDASTLVLLTDGASPVPGFEQAAQDFIEFARDNGVTISTTKEAFL